MTLSPMSNDTDKKGSESKPTISRRLPDGTLIELLYRPEVEATSLAIRTPDGAVRIDPELALAGGERLVPYSAGNNLIATGCVRLPSDVGDYGGKQALLDDIRLFLGRYVDIGALDEDLAAHYVLLSWVSDAFNEVPYLRFQGAFGAGKTRALLVIGSLCYKPFFASGASTVSPIFHILDTVGGTLVLDEADLRFSDATADLTKILNNGSTKGLPVLRTMTNRNRELHPQAFRVFGPKLVAMRGSFADEALESRFITVRMDRAQPRRGIPLSLPDAMEDEALALRNRLLAWRFAQCHQVQIDPARVIAGLSPRGNQLALPLLAIIDDENLRRAIGTMLLGREAAAAEIRAAEPEVRMARILVEMAEASTAPSLPVADLTEAYNAERIGSGPPLTAKAAGEIVRRKLGLKTMKSGGVYVIPADQWDRIRALADRYGIASDVPAAVPEKRASGLGQSADYAPGE